MNGKWIDDDDDDELIWQCNYCNKEFDSEKGCMFHENVHCKKRKLNKQFDSSKALYDELYDDDEPIICYRCGRKGHKSTNCYASKHREGTV